MKKSNEADLMKLLTTIAMQQKCDIVEINSDEVNIDDLTPTEQELWKEYVKGLKPDKEKKSRKKAFYEVHYAKDENEPKYEAMAGEHSFADCEKWIKEHGLKGKTYRIVRILASITVTEIVK